MDINSFGKKWRPYVWLHETNALTLEERGAMVDLVCMAMVSPVEGSMCGGLREIAGVMRVSEEHALRLLQGLKEKKAIEVFPDVLADMPRGAWLKITVRVMA
jgi:hypothetical protein